jgi:hypothetical protein
MTSAMECIKRFAKSLLIPSVIPIFVALAAKNRLAGHDLLILFLNLEGGFLLAFTITPGPGVYNNWRQFLGWFFYRSLNYTSTVSYNFATFYLGLLALVVAQVIPLFK